MENYKISLAKIASNISAIMEVKKFLNKNKSFKWDKRNSDEFSKIYQATIDLMMITTINWLTKTNQSKEAEKLITKNITQQEANILIDNTLKDCKNFLKLEFSNNLLKIENTNIK